MKNNMYISFYQISIFLYTNSELLFFAIQLWLANFYLDHRWYRAV